MTIDERADGTMVVTYDSTGLSTFMLVAASLFLLVVGYDVFVGARETNRLAGLLASATTCLLVAVVFLERARFEFTPATRVVTWRRRWALQQRSGSIRFDSIQSVLVDRPIGDEGTPSRRITLRTTTPEDIPITVGYRPDADGAVLQIASRIRVLLGHDAGVTHVNDVKALVVAGRVIDAIRVLREVEGLNLTEAKRRVEDIKGRRQ